MKNMMKIFALGLFVAGSVIFTGCGETTTAPAEETPAAETGTEAGSDNASTEAAAGNVATVSFNVEGMAWGSSWAKPIKAELAKLPGVAVENVVKGKVTVSGDVDNDKIVAAIKDAGFEASVATE